MTNRLASFFAIALSCSMPACGPDGMTSTTETTEGGGGGSGSTQGTGAGGSSGTTCEPAAGATVGLLMHQTGTQPGYTLFAPLSSTTTHLIDECGRQVHSWPGTGQPGNVVHLLEDGDLLRTENIGGNEFKMGGTGGRVMRLKWDGTVAWRYEYATSEHRQHHDAIELPNGNVLLIAWEKKSAADAVAAGRNPSTVKTELWADTLIEIEPTGTSGGKIVWEWHVWDHLIQDHDASKANYGQVGAKPERVDVNYGGTGTDWNHINGVAYNAALDQLVVSVHNLNEIWILDHSTTTAEAASSKGGKHGKGGGLLYRWGNPAAYRAGTSSDQVLFGQHDAHWIDAGLPGAGNILVFNNGMGRPGGKYSSIEQIAPPVDAKGSYSMSGSVFGPTAPSWHYQDDPPQDMYSSNISGAQRLANGNTLICSGANGIFSEVTAAGKEVWRYQNPVVAGKPLAQGEKPSTMNGGASVFRAYRYSADYPGLAGRTLVPGNTIEK
jgi:hypothetical protein